MIHLIEILEKRQNLSALQMETAMRSLISGALDDETIQQFLTALHHKGETAEEITAAVRVLREHATPIKAPADAVDCCGTGGDGAHTYNISTAVALVAAACGVPVAKHGNRASSSKSGAADVLEAMGVNLNAPHAQLENALETLGFAFLMAPNHHSAMRHVASARKSIANRTLFNLTGPLMNPAGTSKQLIGVYDRALLMPFAHTLKALGSKRAMIVHGSDGLDEITITGETYAVTYDQGEISEKTLHPDHFGLPCHSADSIKGGDATVNASALAALLNGEKSAYRDIVVMNTAAVLWVSQGKGDFKMLANQAIQAIDSGKAYELFHQYRLLTQAKSP